MLTNSLRVKLGDFGIARMFDDESMNTSGAGSMNSSMRGGAFDQTANCGTVRYMAPEVRGTGPDMVRPPWPLPPSRCYPSVGAPLHPLPPPDPRTTVAPYA